MNTLYSSQPAQANTHDHQPSSLFNLLDAFKKQFSLKDDEVDDWTMPEQLLDAKPTQLWQDIVQYFKEKNSDIDEQISLLFSLIFCFDRLNKYSLASFLWTSLCDMDRSGSLKRLGKSQIQLIEISRQNHNLAHFWKDFLEKVNAKDWDIVDEIKNYNDLVEILILQLIDSEPSHLGLIASLIKESRSQLVLLIGVNYFSRSDLEKNIYIDTFELKINRIVQQNLHQFLKNESLSHLADIIESIEMREWLFIELFELYKRGSINIKKLDKSGLVPQILKFCSEQFNEKISRLLVQTLISDPILINYLISNEGRLHHPSISNQNQIVTCLISHLGSTFRTISHLDCIKIAKNLIFISQNEIIPQSQYEELWTLIISFINIDFNEIPEEALQEIKSDSLFPLIISELLSGILDSANLTPKDKFLVFDRLKPFGYIELSKLYWAAHFKKFNAFLEVTLKQETQPSFDLVSYLEITSLAPLDIVNADYHLKIVQKLIQIQRQKPLDDIVWTIIATIVEVHFNDASDKSLNELCTDFSKLKFKEFPVRSLLRFLRMFTATRFNLHNSLIMINEGLRSRKFNVEFLESLDFFNRDFKLNCTSIQTIILLVEICEKLKTDKIQATCLFCTILNVMSYHENENNWTFSDELILRLLSLGKELTAWDNPDNILKVNSIRVRYSEEAFALEYKQLTKEKEQIGTLISLAKIALLGGPQLQQNYQSIIEQKLKEFTRPGVTKNFTEIYGLLSNTNIYEFFKKRNILDNFFDYLIHFNRNQIDENCVENAIALTKIYENFPGCIWTDLLRTVINLSQTNTKIHKQKLLIDSFYTFTQEQHINLEDKKFSEIRKLFFDLILAYCQSMINIEDHCFDKLILLIDWEVRSGNKKSFGEMFENLVFVLTKCNINSLNFSPILTFYKKLKEFNVPINISIKVKFLQLLSYNKREFPVQLDLLADVLSSNIQLVVSKDCDDFQILKTVCSDIAQVLFKTPGNVQESFFKLLFKKMLAMPNQNCSKEKYFVFVSVALDLGGTQMYEVLGSTLDLMIHEKKLKIRFEDFKQIIEVMLKPVFSQSRLSIKIFNQLAFLLNEAHCEKAPFKKYAVEKVSQLAELLKDCLFNDNPHWTTPESHFEIEKLTLFWKGFSDDEYHRVRKNLIYDTISIGLSSLRAFNAEQVVVMAYKSYFCLKFCVLNIKDVSENIVEALLEKFAETKSENILKTPFQGVLFNRFFKTYLKKLLSKSTGNEKKDFIILLYSFHLIREFIAQCPGKEIIIESICRAFLTTLLARKEDLDPIHAYLSMIIYIQLKKSKFIKPHTYLAFEYILKENTHIDLELLNKYEDISQKFFYNLIDNPTTRSLIRAATILINLNYIKSGIRESDYNLFTMSVLDFIKTHEFAPDMIYKLFTSTNLSMFLSAAVNNGYIKNDESAVGIFKIISIYLKDIIQKGYIIDYFTYFNIFKSIFGAKFFQLKNKNQCQICNEIISEAVLDIIQIFKDLMRCINKLKSEPNYDQPIKKSLSMLHEFEAIICKEEFSLPIQESGRGIRLWQTVTKFHLENISQIEFDSDFENAVNKILIFIRTGLKRELYKDKEWPFRALMEIVNNPKFVLVVEENFSKLQIFLLPIQIILKFTARADFDQQKRTELIDALINTAKKSKKQGLGEAVEKILTQNP